MSFVQIIASITSVASVLVAAFSAIFAYRKYKSDGQAPEIIYHNSTVSLPKERILILYYCVWNPTNKIANIKLNSSAPIEMRDFNRGGSVLERSEKSIRISINPVSSSSFKIVGSTDDEIEIGGSGNEVVKSTRSSPKIEEEVQYLNRHVPLYLYFLIFVSTINAAFGFAVYWTAP